MRRERRCVQAVACATRARGVEHDERLQPRFRARARGHVLDPSPRVVPFVTFALTLLVAAAQDSVPPPARDTLAVAAIARFVDAQMAQHGIPGLALALVDGERVVWAKGFGRIDPADSTRRVTADTPFRVTALSPRLTDALRREVLAPRGMTGARDDPNAARHARGTMWTLDGRTFPAPGTARGLGPTADLTASVVDLARLLRMVLTGGMGPRGFVRDSLDGARRIRVGGSQAGFSAELEALPDERLGAAVTLSLDGAHAVAGRIASEALRLWRAARAGEPVEVPRATHVIDAPRRGALEGTYRGSTRTVELEDRLGDLWLDDLHGGTPLLLRAIDDTSLIADGRLAFGAMVRLLPTDGGRARLAFAGDTFVRTPERRPAPPPAAWRAIIGEYGEDDDVLYLLERDGRLFALVGWFQFRPLEVVDGDRLRFPTSGPYAGRTMRLERDRGDGSESRVTAVRIGDTRFRRRAIAPEDGSTFRITPQRPIEILRREALAAAPPPQPGRETGELVDLVTLDPGIRLDIRYATTDNFMGAVMYERAQARLQRPAAEALARVQRTLASQGYGLLIHDAYRPWYVTRMFWDATPDSQRVFVADPANGSRHNRGAAVDLSLYDLRTGRDVPMVSGYDEFSPRAYPFYPGGTSEQRWFRALLRRAMQAEGFIVYDAEWWHFDHESWRRWAVGNTR
jgi:D-alanyl-D-alanine dipeptidase